MIIMILSLAELRLGTSMAYIQRLRPTYPCPCDIRKTTAMQTFFLTMQYFTFLFRRL